MADREQTIEQLQRRLGDVEAVIEALQDGSADAIVAPGSGMRWITGSGRLYRAFFNAMNEGGLTLDESARVLHCNPCFCKMVGAPIERIRNRHLLDFVADEDREQVALLLKSRADRNAEAGLLNEKGEPQPVLLSITPLDIDDQHISCVVVTDLRELHTTARAAEAANRAKSTFLANMSHEMRTPMNAITGMVHILRRSGLTSEQADKLAKIENAGQHLLRVINDVLDLSKIEAGKFVLEDAPVQIDALLDNVVSLLGPKALAKGLRLGTHTGAVPRHLRGDPTRLQQALLNYANNAIKFTEHGRVTLSVTLEAESDTAATLRFAVDDTGIGVAPEALARLFTPFEQADSSTTRKYGGTGLGLAITKNIAEAMGGKAGATSIEGRGSTFWFTAILRKSSETAGHAADRGTIESAEQVIRGRHAGKRVLLVEDEPINREISQMLLEAVSLTVELAEDGRAAVEKAKARNFACILMDMQMPVMDGLDATRHIRQLPGHRTTPIIAMTANAFAEDKVRCLDAGMDDFLPKPANPETVYATLVKWLEPPKA